MPSSSATMEMLPNVEVLYQSKPKAPTRDFFPWQDKMGFQGESFFPAACESSSCRTNTALAQSLFALLIFAACESIGKNTQSCASTLLHPGKTMQKRNSIPQRWKILIQREMRQSSLGIKGKTMANQKALHKLPSFSLGFQAISLTYTKGKTKHK